MTSAILDDLHDEYRLARHRADRAAKYPSALEAPPDTCRYCGRFWRRWEGSKLDGHAKCIVDERFRYVLRTALLNPHLTYAAVADALGSTPSVVRSWSFPIRSRA